MNPGGFVTARLKRPTELIILDTIRHAMFPPIMWQVPWPILVRIFHVHAHPIAQVLP
jgi:hypothetical protein